MPKDAGSTQQFVEIKEIRDGIIFLKNGGLRQVLMVTGVNIDLKSEEEQDVVLYGYQNLVNTFDFSMQFIVHSRKLNIDAYLEKLTQRENQEDNGLLRNQISEYREFIKSFVETNAVMAKTFFAVVPYDPASIPVGVKKYFSILGFGSKPGQGNNNVSEGEAREQLSQRADQVISGFAAIGLRAVALNDEELIELFYNLYNPEATEKKGLKIAEESN